MIHYHKTPVHFHYLPGVCTCFITIIPTYISLPYRPVYMFHYHKTPVHFHYLPGVCTFHYFTGVCTCFITIIPTYISLSSRRMYMFHYHNTHVHFITSQACAHVSLPQALPCRPIYMSLPYGPQCTVDTRL